jgi:dihydroxy-acid dehydratase
MMAGHVSPEAERGGPIGLLRDGDRVVIDVAARRLDVEADLSGRAPAPSPRAPAGGVLAKYAALVSSASEGAVTRPPQSDGRSGRS